MQGLKAKFSLRLACLGSVNTTVRNILKTLSGQIPDIYHSVQMKEGVAWPKVYGGGVEVDTGEVFTAQVPVSFQVLQVRGRCCR